MKFNFKILFLLAAGALAWIGCDPKVPVGVYSAPVSTPDRTTVVNFNDLTQFYSPYGVPLTQTASGPLTDVDGFSVTTYNINPFLFEAHTVNNVLSFSREGFGRQ